MKKLMLMFAMFGMSFVFNACTDPVAEMEDGFTVDKVVSVEGDGEIGGSETGPLD